MTVSCRGRVSDSCGCPSYLCRDCISRPVFKERKLTTAAPNNHFAPAPDGGVRLIGHSGALAVLVAVQLFAAGLYLPPVLNVTAVNRHPPQTDHFAAAPDCRMTRSRPEGAFAGAGGYPAIQYLGLYLPPVFNIVDRRHILPRRSFRYRSTPPL